MLGKGRHGRSRLQVGCHRRAQAAGDIRHGAVLQALFRHPGGNLGVGDRLLARRGLQPARAGVDAYVQLQSPVFESGVGAAAGHAVLYARSDRGLAPHLRAQAEIGGVMFEMHEETRRDPT